MSLSRLLCRWCLIAIVFLCSTLARAQSNVTVRVMAANLTGNSQFYGTPELNILKGLKADVVAIQEFQYSSTTTNGVNTPAAFREMIDNTFGTDFVYFREPYTAGGDIPNGIISRYPILTSGSWVDTQVGNRGFAWAQIDLPGTNDLYVVSVHLLTNDAQRPTEASNLTTLIQANFPANAWIIVAGDFNTDSRSEACMTTFKAYLSDNPIPVDNNGNSDTSGNRNRPHDYVLPSFPMTNTLTSLVLPSHTFPNGLVFDSRVYTPLSDVPPVGSNDSANAQHMGVFKDFLVPVQLASGALLAVTPAGGLSSLGHVGGPFSPTNQTYVLSNSGNSNLTWSASKTANWVTLSSTSGALAPGSNDTVTVSINANANGLSASNYSDTVVFTNTTNDAGSTTRSVSLTVNATFPVIVTNGWTLSVENCSPGNGVVDPGETVTVSLSVKNTGTAATSNLVATLLGTSDVNLPSSPQTYGVVSTNGTTVSQPFSFTAGGTCGGVITATLQLQDGAANLGTINFTIPVGLTATVFTQNFDSVAAPSLPAGWTTSASDAQSNWVTSTASADTSPNAAFSPDPGSVGVNELNTPSIAINSGVARLTFRQNYSLALSTTNSSLGYDGGVLEVAIGGGSYTDIVAAGGSFVTGGYNTTLSGSYSNALAGRQAWSGSSGGFTTTVVNLPATAADQSIQLRWRCASGTNPPSVSFTGTLAGWDTSTLSTFGPSPFASTTNAANITVGGLTRGAGVSTSSGAATRAWGGNGWTDASAADAITTNRVVTFTVQANVGSTASFSSISKFDYRRSSTGPPNGLLQYQVGSGDSFHDVTTLSYSSTASTGASLGPIDLSAISALQNVAAGTVVTFRIVNWGASGSPGTWYIFDKDISTASDFEIQGSVTSGGSTVGTGWYVDSVSIQDVFCCIPNLLVADFTGNPTNGPAPLAVTFDDASTGIVSNWFWDFGDGGNTNITTNSVVHTYAAGTWSVTLIVTGPDGVSTNTKASYITAWTPFQVWQVFYFGSISAPSAAADADPDGDGMTNMGEFLAGTDPTDSSSALRITSIAREGVNMRVTWATGVGKTNALQFTTGNAGGSFSNNFSDLSVVTNTTGSATNYVHTGAATNAPTGYYRVRIVP